MEAFVARQPIFDKNNKAIAYELLYRRNSLSNYYDESDADKATLEVIRNSYFIIGIDKVAGGKKAFINFTENLMNLDIISFIPPKTTVIEILESVVPSVELEEKCLKIKEKGYKIALDDFVFSSKYINLIKYADIIKVDFKQSKLHKNKKAMDEIKALGIKLVAEKLETLEDYKEAVNNGYDYFQGYYFCKPAILSSKEVPDYKINYLKILKEINSDNINLDRLEEIIKKDLSISFKLLKYINSAGFYLKGKISSMKQALSLLGEKEVLKWLYMNCIKAIGSDTPDELVNYSLIRAKFSELIAEKAGLFNDSFNAYLTGMLSMMDSILCMPLKNILNEIYVPYQVKEVLCGSSESKIRTIYNLILSYEKAEWNKVYLYSEVLNVDSRDIPDLYIRSIKWLKEI